MYLTFLKNIQQNVTQENYSIDDIFNGLEYTGPKTIIGKPEYNTKTVITDRNPKYHDIEKLKVILEKLQALTKNFDKELINDEYDTFYIPKRSGGLRQIDAPMPSLMEALREMKNIFQYDLHVLYHNAAFAYTPSRNITSALRVHQANKSRWFLKLDIKDFFPNCNFEYVVKTLHKIYPFSSYSPEILKSFLWICFKNDSLPQGTPMSPMLTNLIMIPIDYAIQNYAWENNLCYTRYADDILISGYNSFDWQVTVEAIDTILKNFSPFQLKREKTRYGSSSGRNWNLGLMYNKDNNITVGYRNKKKYKAMLFNLFTAEKENNPWTKEELYHFQGVTSYYSSVEPDYFKNIIKKYENEFQINLKDIYKKRL